jgi:hypothetical protein
MMCALVMPEEVCDARRRLLRVFAGEDFEIGVPEHDAAVAGAERLYGIARLPGGGVRRIRRELEAHRLVARGGRRKMANGHANMIDIGDVHVGL